MAASASEKNRLTSKRKSPNCCPMSIFRIMGPAASTTPKIEIQKATLTPSTVRSPINEIRVLSGAARIIARNPATTCRHHTKNQIWLRRRIVSLALSSVEFTSIWIENLRNSEEITRCTNRKRPIAPKAAWSKNNAAVLMPFACSK